MAESFGADREDILREAKIDPNIFANPKSRVTVDQTMETWKAIARHTGSEDMGLESGLKMRMQFMGVLGYVMMNSPSIFKAYEKYFVHQRLVMSIVFLELIVENDRVKIEGEMQVPWIQPYRYTMDFVMAANLSIIKSSTVKSIHPIKVGFNYPEPDNSIRYHEIFGPAEIEFSSAKPYMLFNKSDMDEEIIGFNSELFQHFELKLEDRLKEHVYYCVKH